jgi:hypothetical protein
MEQEKQGTRPKLSPEHKEFVCACLASGYDPEKTQERLKEEYGITISRGVIRKNYQYGNKWKEKIRRMRADHEKRIMEHPLAIKMNRLNWILESLNEATKSRHDKSYFDKDGVEKLRVQKKNIGLVASLIREARAEVEGEKSIINVNPVTIYLPKKDKE